MTAKRRVLGALAGHDVQPFPTGPLAVHGCARFGGRTLREYSTRAQALAESVLRYHDRFRPDAVWVSADTWVSAEAMGARVGAASDDQPLGGLGPPAVGSVADLDRIPTPDPRTQGRYPMMIEAARRVVEAVGDETCVVACFDQYPFSLAAALMGIEALLLRCIDDPGFVRALLERCEEYAIAYGRALAGVGVDILSAGDSPAGLAGPALYESLALPAERRVIDALRVATGKPVSLHICGKVTRLLPGMAASGATFLEIDHRTDLAEAIRAVGPGMGVWGNLDPVRVLAQGTPVAVREAVHATLATVRAAGHSRFVLSSGCTLAVETPVENLDAFFDAARTAP